MDSLADLVDDTRVAASADGDLGERVLDDLDDLGLALANDLADVAPGAADRAHDVLLGRRGRLDEALERIVGEHEPRTLVLAACDALAPRVQRLEHLEVQLARPPAALDRQCRDRDCDVVLLGVPPLDEQRSPAAVRESSPVVVRQHLEHAGRGTDRAREDGREVRRLGGCVDVHRGSGWLDGGDEELVRVNVVA